MDSYSQSASVVIIRFSQNKYKAFVHGRSSRHDSFMFTATINSDQWDAPSECSAATRDSCTSNHEATLDRHVHAARGMRGNAGVGGGSGPEPHVPLPRERVVGGRCGSLECGCWHGCAAAPVWFRLQCLHRGRLHNRSVGKKMIMTMIMNTRIMMVRTRMLMKRTGW